MTTGDTGDEGRRGRWTTVAAWAARLVLLPLVVLAGLTLGFGWLITRPLHAMIAGEIGVNRELAGDRTSTLNTLTDIGSTLADTPVIIALTVVTAIVFRLVFHRWRESVFLVVAVWSQNLVFLLATVLVERQRPEVRHLDPAPPTSSFPSGHTSAAVGFYCGVALVLVLHTHRHTLLKALWWAIGIGVPLVVAVSRLYRGMHHLTDVSWGLVLGFVCVAVAGHALLGWPALSASSRRGGRVSPGAPARWSTSP
ncbi:phosphatase PAP2 family protein [Sphaerisporangium aureirubrum]|uniref:Phosphatase PAP2 family protein n=1 Tax=Sphaerisporangium aureirubrum TaxID=1544736 RepID=A0ABW1NU92_9ACTN